MKVSVIKTTLIVIIKSFFKELEKAFKLWYSVGFLAEDYPKQ